MSNKPRAAKKKAAKSAKRGRRSAGAAAAALLETEEEPEDDDRPTLEEAAGTEHIEDLDLNIVDLDAETQAAVIESLRAEGRDEDADIAQSRVNAARRREGTRTAELVRLDPDEDDEGIPIGGVQRKFSPPFNDLSIRDWTRKHLGGGKYEILYYGARHEWIGRERFTIPGLPHPWRKQKKLMDEEEETVRREVDESVGGASERELRLEAELNELREMLKRQERQRVEDERERQRREEIERLERKIEEASSNKTGNMAELITALGAAAAPLVQAMSDRMSASEDRRGEMKEVLAAQSKAAAESRAQIMEVLALQNKSGGMEETMNKLMTTFMMERMKPQANPQDFAFDMLKKVIPQAVTSSLEMAQAAAQPGGNDNMLDRVFEMVGPLVERATGAQQAQMGGPMPGQQPMLPQGAMPMGGMMPGYQQQIPPHVRAQIAQAQAAHQLALQQQAASAAAAAGQPPTHVPAPQAGQWPYSQATQAEPAPPHAAVPNQQLPQAYPYTPPTAPPAAAVPPQAAPPFMTGYAEQVMPGQQVAPTAPAPAPQQHPQTNPQAAHVNPALFLMMEQYLASGKSGEDLAAVVDDQIESVRTGQQAGPALLSEVAIGYLEQYPPNLVAPRIWEACPPEMMTKFVDPQTGQIAQHVKEFVFDFFDFYYGEDEEEAEMADAAAVAAQPTVPHPTQADLVPPPASAAPPIIPEGA